MLIRTPIFLDIHLDHIADQSVMVILQPLIPLEICGFGQDQLGLMLVKLLDHKETWDQQDQQDQLEVKAPQEMMG